MKFFLIIATSLLILSFEKLSSIYDISFSSFDGEQKSMTDYSGKKILVIVLPGTITDADTSFLNAINNTNKKYKQQLNIIGVPSMEDGYTASNANKLKQWYKKYLDANVVITAPMYTRKTSSAQHALFSWLTKKENNTHFDEDVAGVGHKFFISSGGELYSVFDPPARLNQNILEAVLNK